MNKPMVFSLALAVALLPLVWIQVNAPRGFTDEDFAELDRYGREVFERYMYPAPRPGHRVLPLGYHYLVYEEYGVKTRRYYSI